jgi:S-methylmethionine-dependent homocysteine/selenocysteine methylase
MSGRPLARALRENTVLLLDGATGTELQRRGYGAALPLWSARALLEHPQGVLEIHREYVSAGADILTANTFRTTGRAFRSAGLPDASASATARAIALARSAARAAPRKVLVAGSMAPLEDCYRPDLVPADEVLEREHREMAGRLAEAGADFLLAETLGTIREAEAACRAARGTGREVAVSFLCHPDGRLYGGESLEEAIRRIEPLRPAALAVNCVAPGSAEQLLRMLRASTSLPCGVYANAGTPGEEGGGGLRIALDAQAYALLAAGWLALGASIVGGCCGTTPAYIRELRKLLDERGGRPGGSP